MIGKRRSLLTNLILLGILSALFTGIAIGVQSTLSGRIGSLIGTFKTGVMMNIMGGTIGALIFVTLLIVKGKGFWQLPVPALVMLIIAGALGIMIVMGVSFSLQKTGAAAGLATIFIGQIVISMIIDAKGWGGLTPIPITWPRIVGLLVMATGLLLLLPKKT